MQAYLGDGLYAEWDGFQIRLWTERDIPSKIHEVFLDEHVWLALREFVGVIEKAAAQMREERNANRP